jgi:hypothetical protein
MKTNFNLTINKTKEFTEPLLIKDGCGGCELDYFFPGSISITEWTSNENKKTRVIIKITCGETIETGLSSISMIDLFVGTDTISKIDLPTVDKNQSVWIQGMCIKEDSIEMVCTFDAPELATVEAARNER